MYTYFNMFLKKRNRDMRGVARNLIWVGIKSKAHTGHWRDIEFVLGQGDKTAT